MTDVVIVGAGPTGLMLAGELALAGIDVVIVERRVSQEVEGSRARGLQSRTIEVLDQRGIAERFLAEGTTAQVQSFAMVRLDISDFPSRHNYGLALLQNPFERILADWVEELGVPVRRAIEVVGFAQDGSGCDVELSDGSWLRTGYLLGCDGGRSLIRTVSGIGFPGWEPSVSSLIAEVETTEEPILGLRRDENGQHAMSRLDDGVRVGVVVSEKYVGQTGEPTLAELGRALTGVYGTDFGVHDPTWISRFTDATRQAAAYRAGRVLLAGDAAHIHYPVGGQGINLGVQDAANLGWKLAQVIKGTSPEGLLDTYQAERHPVAARALQSTMGSTVLTRSDPRIDALRGSLTMMLGMEEPRKTFAAMVSGLDIRYDLGDGHPLVGRRIPDLDLDTAQGPTRVFALLHAARAVLLDLGGNDGFDLSPWTGRVELATAEYDGAWTLPVIGDVTPPPAVLIRPDGYVAWAGDLTDPALPQALTTWFGPPRG